MAHKFKTRSIYCKSGYFGDSLFVGLDNSEQSSGFVVSGVDFSVLGASVHFENKPFIGGVPIALSGEVESPDLSGYAQLEYVQELSGFLQSQINNLVAQIAAIN